MNLSSTDFTQIVAGRICEQRKKLNYTQAYVAQKLKITQTAYSKIESGATNISIQRLFEIAEVLKTDVVSFIKQMI